MKKIMFIIPSFGRGGGAENIATSIINYFATKYSVVLVLVKERGKYFNKIDTHDIKLIELKRNDIKKSFYSVYNVIKKESPAIVFSFGSEFNIFMGFVKLFFKDIKFIGRESTIISEFIKMHKKNILMYKLLYKYVYNKLDVIIAQSNFMKNDLILNMGLDKDKIFVINNPISEKIYLSSTEIVYEKKFDKKEFLYIGRLSKEKQVDHIIKAFYYLEDNYVLNIVGDGENKEDLIELAKSLKVENKVFFHGFQDNPYAYIKQSDCLILTSRYEGFPNVILEALALGKPSIVYRMSGGTEEIIENNKTGIIINSNIDSLVLSLKEFESNLFDSDYIKTIANKYSTEVIMKKYVEIL